MSTSLYNSIYHLKNPIRSELSEKINTAEGSILNDLNALCSHGDDLDQGQRIAINTLKTAWPFVTEDYASEAVVELSNGNENIATCNFQVLTIATALIHKISFWGDAKRQLNLIDHALVTNQPELVYPKEKQEEEKEKTHTT